MILHRLSATEMKLNYYNLKALLFKLVLFLKYLLLVILCHKFLALAVKTGRKHFFVQVELRIVDVIFLFSLL